MNGYFEGGAVIRKGPWEAVVLPAFGMNCVSLRADGRKILREAGDMDTLVNSPFLYGTPLLFPANRTANGQFTFEGVTYHLPVNEPNWNNHLHGQMFDAPFTVIEKTESTLAAVYENKGERYPFPFKMTIRDEVTCEGYARQVTVENTGSGNMPYTLAFHTAFVEPDRFRVQIGQRHVRSATFVPTGRMENLSDTEKTYLTGCRPNGIAISGYYEAAGEEAVLDDIRFTMSSLFDQRVLFNAGGKSGFLCIEPQIGWVNGLNIEKGHRVIAPCRAESAQMTIGKV